MNYPESEQHRPNKLMTLIGLVLIMTALLIFGTACTLPGAPAEEAPGAEATAIAGTVAARGTDGPDSGEQEAAETETPEPQPTDTAGPTDTPTQVPTETPTPTPDKVLVGVTGDTFCRTGPGSVYDQQAVLNTDQQSEILARDPSGSFWYIANPDGRGECWIWGNYATPEGPTDQLPAFTPPPTPTPSLAFSADFHLGDIKPSEMYIWFVIKNTGGSPLESVRTVVKSKYKTTNIGSVKEQTSTSTFNAFHDQSLALNPPFERAEPGQTVYTISGKQLPIHSQNIVVTMTVCSRDNLNGSCVTREMQFRIY